MPWDDVAIDLSMHDGSYGYRNHDRESYHNDYYHETAIEEVALL